MTSSPVITNILAVPGPGTAGGQNSPPAHSWETISIGVVLDGKHVAWGECVAAPTLTGAEEETPFRIMEGTAVIQNQILPLLKGQPLNRFRPLAAQVDSLTEIVTITRPLPPAQPAGPTKSFSRRDLFTERVWDPEWSKEIPTEQMTVKRPIHHALRYGVSQALLAAVATSRRQSIAEVVAAEYGLPLPETAVAIHLEIAEAHTITVDPMLIHSWGYTTASQDFKSELGKNAQRLQRYVRELKTYFATTTGESYRPTIHLDVRGGLGQLYDNDTGKILGALFGLEKAAAPYPLRVANPIIAADRETQAQKLRQLKEYLRLRRMKLQLVGGADIHTVDDAITLARSQVVDLIHLPVPQLGSLHQAIAAVQACQDQGMGVLLDGSTAATGVAMRILCHVALAVQPDFIMVKSGRREDKDLALVHNEMARTVAEIAVRR